MTIHYKATHSSGTVQLRSSGRTYTWAVVGKAIGAISCCGTQDLARKEQASQAAWATDREVVPLVEITSKEYRALKAAQLAVFQVTFMGKVKTTSRPVDTDPYTHAVHSHRPERESTWHLDKNHHKSWWDKFPDGIGRRIDKEQNNLSWFLSAKQMLDAIERDAAHGRTSTQLEVTRLS